MDRYEQLFDAYCRLVKTAQAPGLVSSAAQAGGNIASLGIGTVNRLAEGAGHIAGPLVESGIKVLPLAGAGYLSYKGYQSAKEWNQRRKIKRLMKQQQQGMI